MAKIALIIFFAGYLVVKRDALALARTQFLGIDLPRGRDLGPILVAWLISLAVLVFERDLGTSLLFFGLFVAMLYVATDRRGWLVIGAGLFLVGSTFAYYAFGHVRERVDVWLHPFADVGGAGYQIDAEPVRARRRRHPRRRHRPGHPDLVPYAKTDFIVAAVGEELGLTGLMAMLVLYAILVERGLRTALAARDVFGQLLACGLAFVMGLQVFVVVGGVTNLIPLTGLTTPFLSAGGSSLVANWMVIALLLRVSDTAARPAPVPMPISRHRRDAGDRAVIGTLAGTIRRLAIFVGAAVRCAAGQHQPRPGHPRQRPGRPARATTARHRGVRRAARPDPRRRHPGRPVGADRAAGSSTSARTPTARCTRRPPASTRCLRRAPAIERTENAVLSGTDARLLAAASSPT